MKKSRFIYKPGFSLELKHGGAQIVKFPVYLSTDNKWWVTAETMILEFGYGEGDLKSCRENYKTIFVADENRHYFSLADIMANEEVSSTEYLLSKQEILR